MTTKPVGEYRPQTVLQPQHAWPFPVRDAGVGSGGTGDGPAPVDEKAPAGVDLDSDKPLTGGACNLDGTCEACQ